jgi:hypothetical protein
MKLFGRLILLFAALGVTLIFSGSGAAQESGSSSATAYIDFIPGDLDHMNCTLPCNTYPNPVRVSTIDECEALCRSRCNVSSCTATPPPIKSGTPSGS